MTSTENFGKALANVAERKINPYTKYEETNVKIHGGNRPCLRRLRGTRSQS